MAAVFGQLGTEYSPPEFFAGVEQLQRCSTLLRQALDRELSPNLDARAKRVICFIDNALRTTTTGFESVRLYLPCEYSTALYQLPAVHRERFVRIAVQSNAASLSLQKLVSKTTSIRGLRKRLESSLGMSEIAPLMTAVGELLVVVEDLSARPATKKFQ
ncbi:MAG: hypothetical protein ACSHX7_00035 [Luteolibacter sp.]